MGLFTQSQIQEVNEIAKKSKKEFKQQNSSKPSSINNELNEISESVKEYFKDSEAILIESKEALHEYVSDCIDSGYYGIDTETTGLDRIRDTIVGVSLYYPGGYECYIPSKHLIPIFEEPYKHQLSYEEIAEELQRLVDSDAKAIFANADFDIAMIYKDMNVDFCDACYYDVILAWRCLKEDEKDNTLKGLYNKYVLKGEGDPMKFSDFFSPKLFPYCKPEVAKLYAANDAKITYELFAWQLPYVTKTNDKCKNNKLEKIADLIWNVEFPLIKVCANMHRTGIYLDKEVADKLKQKYNKQYEDELEKLQGMVDVLIEENDYEHNAKRPFKTGKDFNPKSPPHVKYLCNKLLKLDIKSTDKNILRDINLPETNKILDIRSLSVLINTFVEKLPKSTTSDSRIHAQFKQIGASTGRFCIAEGTKITVLNGQKNIEDIEPGDMVYCYDDSGRLQLSKVKNTWLTGKSKDCVKIKWQSSGKGDIGELICTPEHRVLKKDGTWTRADELKRYDKVAHLRRSTCTSSNRRPELYGWNGISMKEQDVVKYSIFGCTDSKNFVIHHVDENPNNNDLDNLVLMSVKDHTSYHSKKMDKEGKLKYEHLKSEECIQSRIQVQNKNYINRVKQDKQNLLNTIAKYKGRISNIPGDFNSFKHKCEVAGIDLYSECKKYNPKYYKDRISEDDFRDVYVKYNGLAVRITEHFNISYDKFYKYCSEYGISRNHMIQSVKYAGKFDVYDIEVEGYHNFIANEICVHNSSAEPNMQNIPSHVTDIRHMLRATPGYIMLSSDYSQQEPALTSYVSQDPNMLKAFKDKKDIYATIASLAFNTSYENCLEFHPKTGEYQPDGKSRRNQAKTIVLGITYGRSVMTIGEQLFGKNKNMTEEDKTKKAQAVYDSVLNAFPNLRKLMINSQNQAKKHGYVETILGRRRHIPDMQLPEFEFKPMEGYMNPDIDPLDISTLDNKEEIPQRLIDELDREFKSYKYYGQIVKRTKELYEQKIKVVNNYRKITEASRKCTNSIIQGSAAELTKIAILKLESDERWKSIGGRLLVPVHDELICEVPIDKVEEGKKLVSEIMIEAGSFLPFKLKCDVEVTHRWYGLSYPCKYVKPNSLDTVEPEEIKWIQYHLFECQYDLPIHKELGDLRGDAALGVDGVVSEELDTYIEDYINRYSISKEEFLDHIEHKVKYGG